MFQQFHDLQIIESKERKKKIASNYIHSIWSCLANLLDESWAGEIWELFGSSSHSSDVIRFVGVNGRSRSGSWSAVTDTVCCITLTLINNLNLKIEVAKFFNEILPTHIRFGKHCHSVNLQIQVGKDHRSQG